MAPNPIIAPTPAPAPAPLFTLAPGSSLSSNLNTITTKAPTPFQFGGNSNNNNAPSSTFQFSGTIPAPVTDTLPNIFTTKPPAGLNPFDAINPFSNPSSASSNSFGKSLASTSTFSFPSNPATAVNEEDGEDVPEPILEPEQVLKNQDDTDEIILEVQCKAYRYNLEDKEWKDMGKGKFRVTKDPMTKKQRMLIRNDVGRTIFNAAFFKAMEFKCTNKGIRFSAVTEGIKTTIIDDGKGGTNAITEPETSLKNFMIKLNKNEVSKTSQLLENIVKSLP
jgi:hypothetical protein